MLIELLFGRKEVICICVIIVGVFCIVYSTTQTGFYDDAGWYLDGVLQQGQRHYFTFTTYPLQSAGFFLLLAGLIALAISVYYDRTTHEP